MDIRNIDGSLPTMAMQSWILEAMLAAMSNGETVSIKEMDYAYNSDLHVGGFLFNAKM